MNTAPITTTTTERCEWADPDMMIVHAHVGCTGEPANPYEEGIPRLLLVRIDVRSRVFRSEACAVYKITCLYPRMKR